MRKGEADAEPQRHKRLWWLAALWAGLIALSSSSLVTMRQLSGAVSRITGGLIGDDQFYQFWLVVWWFFVKGWHAVEFAVLYLLIRLAWKRPAPAVALLLAIADEFHQVAVPMRGGRISDVCIDAIGIALAWWWVEKGKGASLWLKAGLIAASVLAIYLLAIFPFGLIEFGEGGHPLRP